jgi:hypothetical protein
MRFIRFEDKNKQSLSFVYCNTQKTKETAEDTLFYPQSSTCFPLVIKGEVGKMWIYSTNLVHFPLLFTSRGYHGEDPLAYPLFYLATVQRREKFR